MYWIDVSGSMASSSLQHRTPTCPVVFMLCHVSSVLVTTVNRVTIDYLQLDVKRTWTCKLRSAQSQIKYEKAKTTLQGKVKKQHQRQVCRCSTTLRTYNTIITEHNAIQYSYQYCCYSCLPICDCCWSITLLLTLSLLILVMEATVSCYSLQNHSTALLGYTSFQENYFFRSIAAIHNFSDRVTFGTRTRSLRGLFCAPPKQSWPQSAWLPGDSACHGRQSVCRVDSPGVTSHPAYFIIFWQDVPRQ